MVPSWLLDEVSQQLENHPEYLRIRKLTFAVCQNAWESDAKVLEQYRLRDIIHELVLTHPTQGDLGTALHNLAIRLNRPTEYVALGQGILKVIGPLYQDPASALARLDVTGILSGEAEDTGPLMQSPYEAIANTLAQSPNANRIKKLLYSVCSGGWENDPQVLAYFKLPSLVQQLHQLAPDLETLASLLNRVVSSLNRRVEYTQVAQSILEGLTPLYRPPAAQSPELAASPEPNLSPESLLSLAADFNAADLDDEELMETAVGLPPAALGFEEPIPQEAIPQEAIPQEPGPDSSVLTPPKDRTDLSDLRVEIMQYTNPLRAKLLLFSSLYHPFESNSADWSKIRNQTLGDLLRQLFDHYSTYDSVEVGLQDTARSLDQVEDYEQAAGAIARALRPYYNVGTLS